MIKLWRGVAAGALAAGMALASQAPAFAAGRAAPRVTIGARSAFQQVGRDVYVEYDAGHAQVARVLGRVSRAARGDKIKLYAQEFPYNQPYALAATRAVRGRSARYSFAVRPGLATRYRAELFSHAGRMLASSPTTDVYVTPKTSGSMGATACAAHRCRTTETVKEYFPASAGSTEQGKRVYPYAAVMTTTIPPWLYRNGEHARVVSTPVGVSQVTTKITFSWRFSGKPRPMNVVWMACTKDTVAKDGLGLPGHHGCGARRVRPSVSYLG